MSNFAVSRNTANNKIHVTTSLHPRTCRRALDKINAMEEGAGYPEKVLRYLSRWAAWWVSGYWQLVINRESLSGYSTDIMSK